MEIKTDYEKKISILIEDLSSLENYILDLFTFSPLPICLISPVGVILEFNPAFEEISGYKFYEVVGEKIEKIFEKNKIKELIKDTLENKEVKLREIILFTKDEKEITISAFTKLRKDEEGKVVGFFMGIFDLTEIKKKERKLQEKIKELEKFYKIAIDRELKMIELKKEIKRLKDSAI
jgi:PAS domain S-box-containing protein